MFRICLIYIYIYLGNREPHMHNDTHLASRYTTRNIGSIGLASAPVDLVLKYQVGMQSGDSASSMFVYLILFKLCPKGHEWFAYYVVHRSIIGWCGMMWCDTFTPIHGLKLFFLRGCFFHRLVMQSSKIPTVVFPAFKEISRHRTW